MRVLPGSNPLFFVTALFLFLASVVVRELKPQIEWKIRGQFEKEVESADRAIAAQMDEEKLRVAKLKVEINKLLDQLEAQDLKREREAYALRRRVVDAREAYYEGVLKRQGSYRNTGSYGAGGVSALSRGSSIGTFINKDEGATTRIIKMNGNELKGEFKEPTRDSGVY